MGSNKLLALQRATDTLQVVRENSNPPVECRKKDIVTEHQARFNTINSPSMNLSPEESEE
jgi:hypothetical protein